MCQKQSHHHMILHIECYPLEHLATAYLNIPNSQRASNFAGRAIHVASQCERLKVSYGHKATRMCQKQNNHHMILHIECCPLEHLATACLQISNSQSANASLC